MKAIHRIMKALSDNGLKPSIVEKELGLSNGYLATMHKREGNLGEDVLTKVSKYLNYSLSYLINGEESLNTDYQQPIKSLHNDGAGETKTIGKKAKETSRIRIPLIPAHAMGGYAAGEVSINDFEVTEFFEIPVLKGVDFLIRVDGASMLPKYNGGDIVACRKCVGVSLIQWNKVYVLDTVHGPLIKRLRQGKDEQHLLCVSENKDYAPFELPKEDIRRLFLVVGSVCIE